jgi:hypothetical protein
MLPWLISSATETPTADLPGRYVSVADPDLFEHFFAGATVLLAQLTQAEWVRARQRIQRLGEQLKRALFFVVTDLAERLYGELSTATVSYVGAAVLVFCGFEDVVTEYIRADVPSSAGPLRCLFNLSTVCRAFNVQRLAKAGVALRATLFAQAFWEQDRSPLQLLKNAESAVWIAGADFSFADLRLCTEKEPADPQHSRQDFEASLVGATWQPADVDRIGRVFAWCADV